ncbi:ABC transporter substrate-binding protein [bacterium]|nr:ABC transporter substrate-binding protein [bacterium]
MKKFNITPICFKYPNIDTIHKNILEIGKITGKEQEAKKLVEESKRKIALAKTNHPKKILYLVQTSPLISIGKKSFITDVIKKSGNISITENINTFYPTISEEYAIKEKPDIIVLGLYSDDKRIKKLFPNAKIVFMNTEENNIINRPGPRIHQSVEYFSKL